MREELRDLAAPRSLEDGDGWDDEDRLPTGAEPRRPLRVPLLDLARTR